MTTRKVLLIGRFREFGYDTTSSLAERRGRGRWTDKSAVVAYLRAGKVLVASPGFVPDVFNPTGKSAGSLSVRTDGRFAWKSVLAHYVDVYDLELPNEFVEHMVRQRFQIPADLDVRDLQIVYSSVET